MRAFDIPVYGALLFGIVAVVLPIALARGRRKAIPMFASMAFGMASLTCVSAVMGLSACAEEGSMFYDTAPAFMYCSVALLVMVVAINGWLLWRSLREERPV